MQNVLLVKGLGKRLSTLCRSGHGYSTYREGQNKLVSCKRLARLQILAASLARMYVSGARRKSVPSLRRGA